MSFHAFSINQDFLNNFQDVVLLAWELLSMEMVGSSFNS